MMVLLRNMQELESLKGGTTWGGEQEKRLVQPQGYAVSVQVDYLKEKRRVW